MNQKPVSPPQPPGDEVVRANPPVHTRTRPVFSNAGVHERRIGEILQQVTRLSDQDVKTVLDFQLRERLRFGEAAVQLKLVRNEDVVWALAKQQSYTQPASVTPEGVKLHPDLVMAAEPGGQRSEAFRTLRTHLALTLLDRNRQTARAPLAIVSPASRDGKTFIAANLAIAFAQLRYSTVIVDADLRSPRMHELFGITPQVGLSDALAGRTAGVKVHDLRTRVPNLCLLPCGSVPQDPTELLHSSALDVVLAELSRKFDIVIVDTAAAELGSDAYIVAEKCGQAMMVVRKDATRQRELQNLLEQLGTGRCKVIGPLLNG